ncbi:MAG: hypothetical protein J6A89_01330 [Clostridia bacterium]|nr:hypothetical protein [Clostridia bacterium]
MISGTNFIDLNQKNKAKQKKIDRLPNKQRATVIKSHINYIGRTKGAENNGEHSLFGTLNNDENIYRMKKSDILAYIKDKVSLGAYVYKTIISLTGEDSEKYGYATKNDWENLIRANINTIADEYNIKIENLDWVASFHTEENHPHIHFVFFDKSISKRAKPYIQYDKIKQKLNYSIYKKDIQPLLDEKNIIKKEIKNVFQDNIDEIVYYDSNKIFNNKITDKDLNEIALALNELYKIKESEYKTTKKGSWKMQYQSPEVKEKIRAITEKIIESSSQIKDRVNSYINACIETEKIKNINNTPKQTKRAIDKIIKIEREFILKKVDNQILNYLKEARENITSEQEKCLKREYEAKEYNKLISNILLQRMSYLFTNINDDLSNTLNVKKYLNKKTINLSLSKRAKKEFALKHRDIGIIDWEK